MRRARPGTTAAALLLCTATLVQAEISVLQRSNGSSAAITDLGNGIGIISDPHGNLTPKPLAPHLDTDPSAPHGHQVPSPTTPFGTPAPPSNLTPAPVLPFNPNRALLPAPSTAPPPPPLSAPPSSPGSSMGRFGR